MLYPQDNHTLSVFQSCPIYDTEANKVFELTATRHGNKIECEYTDTKASFKIAVANTDKTVEIAPNFSGKVIIEL